jgi:hypothetical protein
MSHLAAGSVEFYEVFCTFGQCKLGCLDGWVLSSALLAMSPLPLKLQADVSYA